MTKRRAVVDSDDENVSVDGTPASKRARTEESDAEPLPPVSDTRASKRKGKARHKEDDDSESEDDGDASDAGEADRKFEEEFEASIRASIESRTKVHGGIADHGIIEAIELHQFMCHQRLTFTFGPQMNFIIGHNGSGKSAVLTGITVALGGKAAATGRGSGLKSFIREGQPAAEVSISLKNQGDEAYKPKEYGKSIIINRRFTREGNSSWKIKAKDGRVISTKKEELAAICDHMNIQVDNPMNVLTQDAARQFLSASSAGDKYKFFLRGTQLSQLNEEYDTCLANVTATAKVLAQKKEAMPDLRAAFKEASTRFEEASKAREQKKKVDELKKELAWAHVNAKKTEHESKFEDVAKLQRRVPKIENSLQEAQRNLAATTEMVAQLEQEHDAIGDRNILQEKKKALQAKIRSKKDELNGLHEQLKTMSTSLTIATKTIEEYKDAIDKEKKRLEMDTESKREESQSKMAGARADVASAEDALRNVREQKSAAEAELKRLEQAGKGVERKQNELRSQVTECESSIESCLKADKDRYAAYGNDIQRVVEIINKTRWHGEKPLGPLGIHVKLINSQYGDLLRSQLGQLLTSFAVTDARDYTTLKRILVDHRNDKTVIHKFKPDLFDYSRGEPPSGVLTVLRALEISDPHVLRIMINKSGIESRVLAPRRIDAENTLADLRAGVAWTLDKFSVTRYPDGGKSSVPFQPQRYHPMLLAGRTTDALQRYRDQKVIHERELQEAGAAVKSFRSEWSSTRETVDVLKARERSADEDRFKAKEVVQQLQNEINADLPVQLSALQSTLEETEAEKRVLVAQAQEVSNVKADLDEKQKELVAQRDKVQEEIDEFTNRKNAAKEKVGDAVEQRTKLLNDITHWENKLADEQTKIQTAETTAAVVQQELEEWTAKATEYCERVVTRRSVETIERSLKSTQAALQEREKSHGASVEEMTIEVNRAKDRMDKADHDLKQMASLNKVLKQSLTVRLARWQEFRRHIALRCKVVFGYHLSRRGYFGKVLFDHQKETLQLKVQTDDQAATQGARDKDPRSLSGGEKSFSTICLLLSLWEAIGCPIRCLDEFDVFMDAVNRRISMKMMIDTANHSDKKQYILITPQDMNNINPGPTVRVQRMSDPERGQGVLQFAG